jgi:hypothetical protein
MPKSARKHGRPPARLKIKGDPLKAFDHFLSKKKGSGKAKPKADGKAQPGPR